MSRDSKSAKGGNDIIKIHDNNILELLHIAAYYTNETPQKSVIENLYKIRRYGGPCVFFVHDTGSFLMEQREYVNNLRVGQLTATQICRDKQGHGIRTFAVLWEGYLKSRPKGYLYEIDAARPETAAAQIESFFDFPDGEVGSWREGLEEVSRDAFFIKEANNYLWRQIRVKERKDAVPIRAETAREFLKFNTAPVFFHSSIAPPEQIQPGQRIDRRGTYCVKMEDRHNVIYALSMELSNKLQRRARQDEQPHRRKRKEAPTL